MITHSFFTNDIALDRENKLKQALAEGYDFVAIETTYNNEDINICYHFFKGEVPKTNKFKEIYNLALFRKNYPEHILNSNSSSDKSDII